MGSGTHLPYGGGDHAVANVVMATVVWRMWRLTWMAILWMETMTVSRSMSIGLMRATPVMMFFIGGGRRVDGCFRVRVRVRGFLLGEGEEWMDVF